MTKEDVQAIRKVVGDMRFIQASAIVASGLNEHKQAQAYMRELQRLDKMLEQEILK